MSSYVSAFRGRPDRELPAEEGKAWMSWLTELTPKIADPGHRTGHVERIEGTGAQRSSEVLTGYVLVDAPDMDGAVAIARGCPGLPAGVSVEVAQTVAAEG